MLSLSLSLASVSTRGGGLRPPAGYRFLLSSTGQILLSASGSPLLSKI